MNLSQSTIQEGPGMETHVCPRHSVYDITVRCSSPNPKTSDGAVTVLNPTFITADFDQLRFEGVAFNQLANLDTSKGQYSTQHHKVLEDTASPLFSALLISSPYNNPGHYLDLRTLPTPSRLFAKALTALRPATPDYSVAPFTDALNFPTVLGVIRHLAQIEGYQWNETSFYVVTFRSKLKGNADVDFLYALDYESHREACESGGLLKYWFGKTDSERRNLATCTY